MSEGLTQQQIDAIALIASGHRYQAVAVSVGVKVRDLVAWVADPEYADALAAARAESVGEAHSVLSGQAPRAVSTVLDRIQSLVDIADGEGKDADRIRANEAAAKLSIALLDRIGLGPSSDVTVTHEKGESDTTGIEYLTEEEVLAMDAVLERMRNGGHEH